MKRKLQRSIYKILMNTGLFWVFMDVLPNAVFRFDALGKLIVGLGFTLALSTGDFIIYFLKLPKLWFAYLIARTITVYGYLWAVDNYLPALLDLGPSYLGNLDLIFMKIPTLLTLPNIYLTLAFSAPFLVICSIILEKIKK